MYIACEYGRLIWWNELLLENKTTLVQGVLKALHFTSNVIDLENEMEQPGWCFLTDESKLDYSEITRKAYVDVRKAKQSCLS